MPTPIGTVAKTTPDDHVIDPSCEAIRGRHGIASAYRYEGCTCPGPIYDDYLEKREKDKAARRARWASPETERQAVIARMTPSGPGSLRQLTTDEASKLNRRPSHRSAGSAERELRARDDLACQSEDDELFFVNGSGGAADAQIALARAVCAACPFDAQRLCLTAALERGDDLALLAGTTPAQRRKLRQGVAA